ILPQALGSQPAHKTLECCPSCLLVQPGLSVVVVHLLGKKLFPLLAEMLNPAGVLLSELILQFTPQPLGESRTLPFGGDGDLQTAASNHGRTIEIAAHWVIHRVA